MEKLVEKLKNSIKTKKVKLLSIAVILLLLIAVAGIFIFKEENFTKSKPKVNSAELARAMTYNQVQEGENAVEGTDNVKFDAFFLRDLDGDGYAESLRGTCKEIGDQDTLYMELNVQTEGYLKDAKIEVNGQNFYLQTTLPKDQELKQNYIGTNVKEIQFNDLNNGTQKLLTGIVKSGDYSYTSTKTAAIGNDLSKLSRDDNKIVLTGTYVAVDGSEIAIRKEVAFTVDWYGETKSELYAYNYYSNSKTYYDLDSRIDEENQKIKLTASIRAEETKNQLNISKNCVTGTIPELNGYAPLEVTSNLSDLEFNYEQETRKFTIERTATVSSENIVTSSIARSNIYTLNISYPLEAYRLMNTDSIDIKIPVSTYYEGFNNSNSEFSNPYKSNTSAKTLIYYFYKVKPGNVYATNVGITVGKYISNPRYRYIVSKQKPLKIYNGISTEEKNDNYTVRWYIYKGTLEVTNGIVMKEIGSDDFVKTDSTKETMESLSTNVGIAFSGASNFLNDDGFIKVYDDNTDELLATFTKDDWGRYTESNPYRYDLPVKNIRVETSETKNDVGLYVYNIKQLDDEYITDNYTREEFDNLQYIESNLSVTAGKKNLGKIRRTAYYEAPYSVASIRLSNTALSTQLTEKNEKITITASCAESSNQVAWKNGTFLIKLPDEILTTKINSVKITNSNAQILSYEYMESEGGKFIKINTQNENPLTYSIVIDAEITPNPCIATVSRTVELWATNEETADYYYNSADIYDVNDNLNVEEKVHKSTTSISLISPNSLLTNQTISEYDESGHTLISPQVADIRVPIAEVDTDTDEKTAKIGVQLINNYSNEINDVVILGKIPFKGNTYVINGEDLKSDFTTKMLEGGLEVPEELQGKVAVYYSENENPDKDITKEENGWKTQESIENWDNIKTYLIDFEDSEILAGKGYIFYYNISIPYGSDYNKVTYSHHGVYFSLNTSEGKYRTSTEPNKIGIKMVEKYNLEMYKYQKGKDVLVAGATYKVIEENDDEEICRTVVTNQNGLASLTNLYVNKTYRIEELKVPDDYEINPDIVRFVCHGENGKLIIEALSGNSKEELYVEKEADENYKVIAKLEDEAKARLHITKLEHGTENTIKGIRYKLTGAGLPEDGKIVTTKIDGDIDVTGLKINEEYTLEEVKANGYYLASPIKFKILNNEGNYEIELIEGTTKESSVTEENSIPTVNMTLEDEKIPTYELELVKIQKKTNVNMSEAEGETSDNTEETVYLAGAKFKLYKGTKELGEYITDENGRITIPNLYQYVAEKAEQEEAKYVLKEAVAPDGYAKVKDINFKVENVGGTLQFVEELVEGQTEKQYTVEGNKVIVTVEDNPSFKLIKKDAETGELLANIKFAIYNVDEGEKPARNSKGEILGIKETINGIEYYIVSTNENGEITADLQEGLYKAVEVEAPDKYDITDSEYYFGIGASREGKVGLEAEWAKGIGSSGSDYINSVMETRDGGIIAGGYFNGTIDLGDGVVLNNNGSYDGMIIKYSADGEVEWEQSIGGDKEDKINVVLETSDGGYIAGGYFKSSSIDLGNGVILNNKSSYTSYSDGMLIKYSAEGEVEWAKGIGGSSSDKITSVAEASDGGYVVGGNFGSTSIDLGNGVVLNNNGSTSYSDGMLIKYSAEGEVEWAKEVGGVNEDKINSVAPTNDGGYIVGGSFKSLNIDLGNDIVLTNSTNISRYSYDGLVIKYSNNGEVEWAKEIGGSYNDEITSVIETSDGGYVAGGDFKSSTIFWENGEKLNKDAASDGMLIKYTVDGELEWIKSTGGNINSVLESKYGGYIVGEKCNNFDLGDGIILEGIGESIIKYSKSGKTESAIQIGVGSVKSVVESKYGGYIVVGDFSDKKINFGNGVVLNNNGYSDGMLIKYNEIEVTEAIVEWAKGIGESGNDEITVVIETTDGGYAIGGNFNGTIDLGNGVVLNNNGHSDGMLIKYSKEGEVEWAKEIGGSYNDEITSVIETSDGGYLVGGCFGESTLDLGNKVVLNNNGYSDGMLIKYSKEGEVEWAKGIGGSSSDKITSVAEASDGGYVVGGYFGSTSIDLGNGVVLNSNGSSDGMLIKYSKEGEVEWAKGIGGTSDDKITSVIETTDDGYAIGGNFNGTIDLGNGVVLNSNGSSDGMLIKYSKEDEVEWAKVIGGAIKSVTGTSDGGYLVGGCFSGSTLDLGNGIVLNNKSSYTSYSDVMLIKYSKEGEVEWAKVIGGTNNDEVTSVIETTDGGYAIGGYFNGTIDLGNGIVLNNYYSTGMLIKYSKEGEVEWAKGVSGRSSNRINAVIETTSGGYVVGGCFADMVNLGNEVILNSYAGTDGMLLKIKSKNVVSDLQELVVENKRKEFKITTNVKKIDNVKGGTISGDGDNEPYEKVRYGENSTKEIIMVPDENYEIISITVNGEEYNFEANEDDSFIMPTFENVQEDKHIVVTYSYKENKIVINKLDSETKEKLTSAKFKLEQIEERSNPENVIGDLTANGKEYTILDKETGILDFEEELINNGTYYFIKKDGKYVPTNSKTYQTSNGGTAGIQSTTANSYIPIDLTNKEGEYVVVVNAECSSESSYDYGYVTVTETTEVPTYSSTSGRFVYISGTQSAKDYTSVKLEGGKTYYLHLGYRKDSSNDTGKDQIIINSINLYNYSIKSYNFINVNGKYESNNQGKYNTVANSYIPIDLTGYVGKYNVTVNAEIVSQSGYDMGYATVTENTTSPAYNVSEGRFIYISGIQEAKNYNTVLEGGKLYYLHFGYYKNVNIPFGDDKFTINSINVSLNDSELYHTEVETNLNGQAITQIPFGKYEVTEIKAPDGYWLNEEPTIIEFRADEVHEFNIENEKKAKVTVHHYLKGTTTKIADDEEMIGKIDDDYITLPKVDISRYELEKDENDKYVLPENANGKYAYEDQEVIYYYKVKDIPLIVHHYIEGTTTEVPLKDGTIAEDEISSAPEGTEYQTNAISNELLDESYHLIEVPENANGVYTGDEVIVTYYYNREYGKLNIIKTDEKTGEPIEGVRFGIVSGIQDINLEEVSTEKYMITNAEGKISILLPIGDYTIFEVNAPNEYEIAKETKNVTLEKEGLELSITNRKKPGKVIVHHYIENTEIPVPLENGAVAQDEHYIGEDMDLYETNYLQNIDDLYEVVSIPENSEGVLRAAHTEEVIYYYRLKRYTLDITKYEKGSNKYLPDIVFQLRDEEDNTNIYTTDNNGKIIIPDLNQGQTYILEEISAVSGYYILETPIKFRAVQENGKMKFEVLEGDLGERENNISIEDADAHYSKVYLEIEDDTIFTLVKYAEDDTTLIPGAKFVIKELVGEEDNKVEVDAQDVYGNLVGTEEVINEETLRIVVTNKNGEINCGLRPGKYKVTEIEAPYGYEITENNEFYFEVGENQPDTYRLAIDFEDITISEDYYNTIGFDTLSDGSYIVLVRFYDRLLINAENTVSGEEICLDSTAYNEDAIIKINSEGKIEWAQIPCLEGGDYTYKLIRTDDGGFITIGECSGKLELNESTLVVNDDSMWPAIIVKFNSNGTPLWVNTSEYESCNYEIIKNNDSTFTISGYNYSEDNLYIMNITQDGEVNWKNEFSANDSVILRKLGNGLNISMYMYESVIPKEYTLNNCEIQVTEGEHIVRYNEHGKIVSVIEGSISKNIPDDVVNGVDFNVIDAIATSDGGYLVAGTYTGRVLIPQEKTEIRKEIILEADENKLLLLKYNSEGKIECVNADKIVESEDIYITLLELNNLNEQNGKYAVIVENQLNMYTETFKEEIRAEKQEIVVHNNKKQYKITTKVDGEGGNISGENEDPYENVIYMDDSTKDIIITPSDGYGVDKVTINGEEVRFVEQEDGTVLLDKFTEVDEDKEVVVSFKKLTSVVVHHYLEGTEEKLSEDVIIEGKVDDEYETIVADDIPSKYELVEIPENATGTMTEDEIVVTYYYKLKEAKVVVHHYIEGTTERLSEDVIIDGSVDDEYETTVADDIPSRYELVEEPENKIGTMTEEQITVIYYYKLKDASVIVHHYLEGTETKVAEDVTVTGKVGDEYETTVAENLPSKYELAQAPVNATGTMTEEQTIVIYYYKLKSTKVIVHHYEEGTTNKLSEDVEIEGLIDSEYTTKAATDVPIKYALVETPANAIGIMTEEVIEVTYYYAVRDAVLNIYYLEKDTDIELAKPEKQTGKVGENYRTDAKEIEGYTLVENSGNTTGQLEVEPLTVIYYYLKNTRATVQYIDITTGEILDERTDEGLVGDEFVTETKTFENYILVQEPEEKTVNMTKEEIVLKYYYLHISAGVIEQHIDVISGDILYNGTHEGNEGDEYNIPSKEFTGYDLVEERLPLNSEGTMTVDPITVTYYYIHRAKVTTQYIDKATGEKITVDTEEEGHEGDYYTTEEKEFDGYKLIQVPENSNGTMTKEDIVVKYYYIKQSAGVVERHLDVLTNEPLVEETRYEGYIGDDYETKEKVIPSYELVRERYPENATGKMTEEEIVVTYYYSRKAKVEVKYVDKITGEEIVPKEVIDGHKGDKYTTEEKEIPGYELVEVPTNKEGTMFDDITEVIYYYIRPAKVITNYYDIDTKEKLAAEEIIEGHEKDEYTTVQKEIKYYNLVEIPTNSKGTMIAEDIRVDYYYKKKAFNLKVDKVVKEISYNGQVLSINGNVGKLELNKNNVATADVVVTYEIKVMNTGELRGGAELIENIPTGMTMSEADNKDWVVHEDTAILSVDDLEAGQERAYTVVMRWNPSENNLGMKENIAQIVKVSNEAGFEEISTDDNEDKADLVISIQTGSEDDNTIVKLAILAIFVILGITVTFIIKKENSKK